MSGGFQRGDIVLHKTGSRWVVVEVHAEMLDVSRDDGIRATMPAHEFSLEVRPSATPSTDRGQQ